MGFWGKIFSVVKKVGTTAVSTGLPDAALDATGIGAFIDLNSLVETAERSFGSGQGSQKKRWVINTITPLLEALDANEEAEFGVKDYTELLRGIDMGIESAVIIRNSTTWFPGS